MTVGFREPKPDKVAGIEARGFILGAPVAQRLGVGFVPVRKKGKLPGDVVAASYDLEYGSATIEVTADAFRPGDRVLIVDDVLATGGTAAATVQLVRECGAEVVGVVVLLELGFLSGREALAAVGAPEPRALLTFRPLDWISPPTPAREEGRCPTPPPPARSTWKQVSQASL